LSRLVHRDHAPEREIEAAFDRRRSLGAQEARRLIIVGEAALDSTSREFLEALRGRFGLPIYYEQFDMSSESLAS
jgi:hypothetical protein